VNELNTTESEAPDEPGPGIYLELGKLPPATVISEDGLAGIMGKRCRESIKRAVARGELPQPVKIMGQNCWTVGSIVKHLEDRLEAEGRKVARLRPSA
jgi:hypothetical protein